MKNLSKKITAVAVTALCAFNVVSAASIQLPDAAPNLLSKEATETYSQANKDSNLELVKGKAVSTADAKTEVKETQAKEEKAAEVKAAAELTENEKYSDLEVLETIDISATAEDHVTLTLFAAPSEEEATVGFRERRAYTENGKSYVTAVVSGSGNMEKNVYRYFVNIDKYIETAMELIAENVGLDVQDMYYIIPEGVKEDDFVDVDANIQFYARKDCREGRAGTQLYISDAVRNALNPSDFLGYSPNALAFEGDITSVSDFAFAFCNDLEEIEIPAGVKTIGAGAFAFCANLKKVVLNDGLEAIGERAFMHCRSLAEIKLPATVTEIGEAAFTNMKDGSKVICPTAAVYELANVKDMVTAETTKVELKEVKYDENGLEILEEIDIAQTGDLKLTLYAAPKQLAKANAFSAATKESKGAAVTTEPDENAVQGRSVDGAAFVKARISGDGEMEANVYRHFVNVDKFIAAMKEIVAAEYGITADQIRHYIPDGVDTTDIAEVEQNIEFYNGNRRLAINDNIRDEINFANILDYSPTEIIFDGDVTSISDGAFLFCTDLEKITIPDTVTRIGKNAFAFCTNLREVKLPAALEEIDEYAFLYCTALEEITLPATVTNIGSGAFFALKDGATIICTTYEVYHMVDSNDIINPAQTIIDYTAN